MRRLEALLLVTMIAGLVCPAGAEETSVAATLPATPPAKPAPFAFADFGWLNGNCRTSDTPLDSKYFTGEFRLDANVSHSFNHPRDHSLVGSTNTNRTDELQVEQLGVGGDFHADNVRGRLMTQFGLYSTSQPRNDASQAVGQWDLRTAYRYVSEAYGGYHWDTWNGINLDAGIFMSYVGLCSYYNFDNWIYQMSYVSANTPWYFQGFRLQTFPSDKLKVELWLINGWQSYGMYHQAPGIGWELLWRPTGRLSLVTNDYYGEDELGIPDRIRIHSDNSAEYKWYDAPKKRHGVDKVASSLTFDLGAEHGNGTNSDLSNFLGAMFYHRTWFEQDKFALTFGGGLIHNPGRYLVLVPPINGATAESGVGVDPATGASPFSTNPGDKFNAWDASICFDYMPAKYLTHRFEIVHRAADVPYFAGPRGITPPGGNMGAPGSIPAPFSPDLEKSETRLDYALLVKF